MNKWRTAAWIQGVRRYNQKKNANQQLKSVVALMLAKKEVQKKIQEASLLGKGSDQRLHDLEEKLILMQGQIQKEHEHSNELEEHEKQLNSKGKQNLKISNLFFLSFKYLTVTDNI